MAKCKNAGCVNEVAATGAECRFCVDLREQPAVHESEGHDGEYLRCGRCYAALQDRKVRAHAVPTWTVEEAGWGDEGTLYLVTMADGSRAEVYALDEGGYDCETCGTGTCQHVRAVREAGK